MAIQRNHKGNGGSAGRIDKPGEYAVTVEKVDIGKSKSGKDMLTVTFTTDDDKSIRGYYVRSLDWHMEALKDLKSCCGLKPEVGIESLINKRCGLAVGEQTPNAEGKIFMTIEGYGKESDVAGYKEVPHVSDDIAF